MRSYFRFIALGWFCSVVAASASSLYSEADARSTALGGEETAQEGNVFSAMDSNPAGLSSLDRPEAAVTFTGALLRGEFEQPRRSASLRESGFIAAGAFAIPAPRQWPVRFAVAAIPDLALESDWRYFDAPGGLGGTTSYGEQTQRSRILSLRTTAAVAVQVTRALSLGASAGFVYNQNALHAPYVFQSQPVLRGFKTLLDLETDGFAPAFDFGAQLRVSSKVTLGLSYRPRTVISTTGRAAGNADAQLQALGGGFAQVDPTFHYDAEIRTELPQRLAAGVEWQALARLRLVGGIDWVNWDSAFDQLAIELKNGSNPAINGVVGADSLTDIAPLHWRDQFVYRAGAEFAIVDQLVARVGYSYGRSPVPNETLTPLTGAIFEQAVAAGLGYRWGRYHVDVAWQWRLPTEQRVGKSDLLAGEYSRSALRVQAHVFQLTTGVEF